MWADDVHDLLELAKTLAVTARLAPSSRLAILTCSGGDSSQGADEASALGIELAELAPATAQRLAPLLHEAATIANPLDYTATIWGDADALAEIVTAVGEDPAVDQLLVFYDQLPGLEGAAEESWRAVRAGIEEGARRSPAPTMVCSTLPEHLDDAAAWHFAQAGVAAAAGLRTGMRAAAAMRRAPGDPAALRAIADAVRAGGRAHAGAWLAEHEAKALLRGAGVAVVEGRAVTGLDQALEVAARARWRRRAEGQQRRAAAQGRGRGARARVAHPRRARGRLRPSRRARRAHDGTLLVERMADAGGRADHRCATRRRRARAGARAGRDLRRSCSTMSRSSRSRVPAHASSGRFGRCAGRACCSGARAPRGRPRRRGRARARGGRALLELDLELVELNPVIAGPAGAVAVDAVVAAAVRSAEEPLEARGGGDAGLDRAVDEAGPAVREIRAGQ